MELLENAEATMRIILSKYSFSESIYVIEISFNPLFFSLLTLKTTFHCYSEHTATQPFAAMRVAAPTDDRNFTDRTFEISLK